MDKDHIILFLFIIVVFTVVSAGSQCAINIISNSILIIAGALLLKYLFNSSEHLETKNIYKENPIDDNYDLSKYGNISMSDDIDSWKQRNHDMSIPESDTIDMSDIVESVIQRGTSDYQPANSEGVTTTSSAYHNHLKLGEPGNQLAEYMVPANESGYNLDQALARKQQHIGSINKRAIDGMVRNTKNVFARTLQNELNENAEREWWSAESTMFESDFRGFY